MDINFPLILVLATLVTGVIWLLDSLFWRPARLKAFEASKAAREPEKNAEFSQGFSVDGNTQNTEGERAEPEVPALIELSRSFFPVLLVVTVLRSFLVEPFQIPSGSMLPTLEVGDFILVNKFAYGVRLPVIGTKIIDVGEPQRGDVFVFLHQSREGKTVNYIKRVIGLPGDKIRYVNKVLTINGKEIPKQFVANFDVEGQLTSQLYVEDLGTKKHSIYIMPQETRGREGEWTVPPGHYFAMGDNRDNSNDSRYWGFVPEDQILGKAFAIWMQWKHFFSVPSFSRVGGIQ